VSPLISGCPSSGRALLTARRRNVIAIGKQTADLLIRNGRRKKARFHYPSNLPNPSNPKGHRCSKSRSLSACWPAPS
jgi:hypothetical protein